MKNLSTILLWATMLFMTSCATLFRTPKNKDVTHEITISSTPPKCSVYNNEGLIGETPMTYTHEGRKKDVLIIRKEGYLEESEKIERQLNPAWTAISVLGGVFPGFGVPILIDFSKGSVYDIKTDTINVNLISVKGGQQNTEMTVESTDNLDSLNSESSVIKTEVLPKIKTEIISFPALEILTGGYKLKILPKTRARFELKNGQKFGDLITGIYDDHFTVKGQDKIYYTSIEKVRFFNSRLWYPILTSVSIFPPIIWYCSGKVAERDSKKCKWDIKNIRVVEGLPEHSFGKAKCD